MEEKTKRKKDSKEISAIVGIKFFENPNQQIIKNGSLVPSLTYALYCRRCGRVVHSLDNPGLTMQEAILTISNNKETLLNNATYCPKCGYKLSYDVDVVDGEFEESYPPDNREEEKTE